MTKFFSILFFALVLLSAETRAQYTRISTDSLETIVRNTPDSLLPGLYCDISSSMRFSYPVMGIEYAMRAVNLADALGDRFYQVRARNILALNERFLKMNNSSLDHYMDAIWLARKYENLNLEGECLAGMARVYVEMGEIDSAKYYNDRSFIIAKSIGDSAVIAGAYLNLGLIMRKQGKSDLSAGYILESFGILSRNSPTVNTEVVVPLWLLINIYMNSNEYLKAKELIYKYFNDMESDDWTELRPRVMFKKAQIFYATGELDSARMAGEAVLEESTAMYEFRLMESASKLLDKIYMAQGNPKKASDVMRKYMALSDTMFNRELIYQLNSIRYSGEYLQNARDISEKRSTRSIYVGLLIFAVVALLSSVVFTGWMMVRNKHIRNLYKELSKKRITMDYSLKYARAIQMAVQPVLEDFGHIFSDKFLLYIPRDAVSGDFFWRYGDSRYEILVVADCTGHGVPGAMLTMLGTSILQDIAVSGIRNSAEILEEMRNRIKFMMAVNNEKRMQDGMDMSIIVIDRNTMTLDFAGAFNNLVYIRDGQLNELKATRCPIGEYLMEPPFKSYSLQLKKDDCIYMMSDGFASQFGGDKCHKYSNRRLMKTLLDNHKMPMQEFCQYLEKHFHEWRGSNEQVDDVTVAGFRV